MASGRRLAVVAAVAALVLAPSAMAATTPQQLLRRVERSFQKPPAHAHRDLSPLMRRLAIALPGLSGADRRRAISLLARPTDGAADPQQNGWTVPEAPGSPLCSAHFCIHWVASGSDAPDLTDADGNGIPDWVQTVDSVAENVYSVENGQLGWRPPKSDGALGGGNGLTDIYLADIGGSGIYGYTAPDPGQAITGADHSQYAYLVIDNDFSPSQFPSYASPLTPLEVTLAHEYNHVLQFNYDSLEDTWMFESTAVWAEGKVYEPAHDYLQYLPGWAQLTRQPMTSFNGQNPSARTNVKVYGSAVWNKFLDARYGQDVVRGAWEDSSHVRPQSFAPAAYDASIRQHGGAGFSDAFDRFSAAVAEWQAQNSGFPDGALYPDAERVGALRVDGAPTTTSLDHTSFALLDVPPTSDPEIKLAAVMPKGTAGALALVGREGGSPGGLATETVTELPKGGGGTVTLPDPGRFARITAVLVNSDFRQSGFSHSLDDWAFKKDRQHFLADASTDFAAPRLRGRAPKPGSTVAGRQKVTATFSEPMLGVTRSSFQLVGPGGRAVGAVVQFTDGSRRATLIPRRALRPGQRYRVRLTSAITDLALNPLRPAPAWSFAAR